MIAYSEDKNVMRNFELISLIIDNSTFEEFIELVKIEQLRLKEKCHDYIGNGRLYQPKKNLILDIMKTCYSFKNTNLNFLKI